MKKKKMKVLVVVDMQNDFVDGALGSKEAQAIVPNVVKKIEEYTRYDDAFIYFTYDSHDDNYLNTQEGRKLPVPHCIKGTNGWELSRPVAEARDKFVERNEKFEGRSAEDSIGVIDKISFGSPALPLEMLARFSDEAVKNGTIEFVGLCTDICVVSNAMLVKAFLPETRLIVDSNCCAGVTPESHKAALDTMAACQIEII